MKTTDQGCGRNQHIGVVAATWIKHMPRLHFASRLLRRNEKRFRGGLVFKAHRLWYQSIPRRASNKEEKKDRGCGRDLDQAQAEVALHTRATSGQFWHQEPAGNLNSNSRSGLWTWMKHMPRLTFASRLPPSDALRYLILDFY